jgi:hypothetical protein
MQPIRTLAILSVIVILALAACQSEKGSELASAIEVAETTKELHQLEAEVVAFLAAHPREDGSVWYGRLAQRATQMARIPDAERYYLISTRDYPDGEAHNQQLMHLARLYKDHKTDRLIANALCCALRDNPEKKVAADATSCCSELDPDIDSLLVHWKNSVFDPVSGRTEATLAQRYISLCQLRAVVYPAETINASHLNEAAKLATSIRDPKKAIDLYDWISRKYPDTPYGPKSVFLAAFTYENYLNDEGLARAGYERFLAEYPDDELARDARLLLDNLGKDPEELIRQFMEQQENQGQ